MWSLETVIVKLIMQSMKEKYHYVKVNISISTASIAHFDTTVCVSDVPITVF